MSNWQSNNPDKVNEGFWIGLTDLNSDPRSPQMEWLFEWGQSPSYTNWIFGQPDGTEVNWPGNTCGFIKDVDGNNQNWDAEHCAAQVSTSFSSCYLQIENSWDSSVKKASMLTVPKDGHIYQQKRVGQQRTERENA